MVKFLLRVGKIHGEQAIVSLKDLQLVDMENCFRNSCFSAHNVMRFHQVIQNIVEYEMSTTPSHGEEQRSQWITKSNTRTLEVGISLVAGFVFGCVCASYMKK